MIVPPASAAESADSRRVLSAASDGAGALCVLALVGNDVAAFRSDDGGRTFGAANRPSLFVGSGSQNPCATIAWDAERSSFAGVAWTFAGSSVAFAGAITSADCRTWEVDETPELASPTHACRDYSIVRGRDGAILHELWATDVATSGDLVLERTWSAVPFGPAMMLTDDPSFAIPDSAALVSSIGRESVHAYAADLLVSTAMAGSIHTFVIDRDLPHARDWLVAGPSHTEGSCDATTLSYPSLYFDAPSEGGIAYSCGSGGFFEGGATVVRTFAITIPPRAP